MSTSGSSSTETPPSLSILSLNCWGLWHVSKHRATRLNEISIRISKRSFDIVALQEFWVYSDYENLRAKTRHLLPYGKFYHSGVLGAGLVILSRFPIVESTMHRYTLNGRPTAFWRGDWYVGKGIACATIRLPDGRFVEVFNTHLHAPYEPHPHDSYLCHRTAQSWELAKLLRKSVERGVIALALGDFNMLPNSLAHALITGYGLVTDSWLAIHPNNPLVRTDPTQTAEWNLKTLGATCDSMLNTWRSGGRVLPPETADPRAQRLDYIFYSDTLATAKNINVGFTEPMRLPTGEMISVSDHFAVELELELKPSPRHVERVLENQQRLVEVDESGSGLEPVTSQLQKILTRESEPDIKRFVFKGKPLPLDLIDEILELTRTYMAREVEQSKWRIWHFWGSVVVLVGLHVGAWWWNIRSAPFVNMLLAWIIAVTGTIDGLIGFLFMYSEMNALKEFDAEIRIYRMLITDNIIPS